MLPRQMAKQKNHSTIRQNQEPWAHTPHRPSAMGTASLSHTTIQRAQATPRTLSPTDILQLQRTVGNQAVLQMLDTQPRPILQRDTEGGSAAGADFERQRSRSQEGNRVRQIQATASPTAQIIQRKLKFKSSDLKGDLSKGAKRGSKVGLISNFRRIQTELERYWLWAAKGNSAMQERVLINLLKLTGNYLKKHKDNVNKLGSNADKKVKSVTRLRAEVFIELKNVPKRVQSEKFLENFELHGEYTRDIPIVGRIEDPLRIGKQVAHNRKYGVSHKEDGNGFLYHRKGYGDGMRPSHSDPATEQKGFEQYMEQKHLGLTPGHRAALSSYTSNQFEYINPAMAGSEQWMKAAVARNNKNRKANMKLKDDDATITKMMLRNKEIGDMVSSALLTLPPWKQTKVLYRGETITEEAAAAIGTGYVKHHNFFVSTSQKIDTPMDMIEHFTSDERPWGVVYQITKSTTGRDISPWSQNAKEQEILFPIGTSFEVTKVLSKDDAKKLIQVEVTAI